MQNPLFSIFTVQSRVLKLVRPFRDFEQLLIIKFSAKNVFARHIKPAIGGVGIAVTQRATIGRRDHTVRTRHEKTHQPEGLCVRAFDFKFIYYSAAGP